MLRDPSFGRRMQIGMVVNNLEEAAQFWSEKLGVGPWIMIENALEDRRHVHRGPGERRSTCHWR